MPFVIALARLTALEGLRARLPWLVALVALTAFLLSQFLAEVSIMEASQISATVLAALLRIAAVFITANFVITSMAREANDKFTDLLLSQPVPRWAYFCGKLSGFLFIACCTGVALSLPLWLLQQQGMPAWTASLLGELAIVTALSLFCTLTFAGPVAAISAVTGFYVLARSMQALQYIAAASVANQPSLADQVMAGAVHLIALVLPALDRMTLSAWLITPPDIALLLNLALEVLVYLVLLSAASLFDLYRKSY